jgi:hypothetical protein
MQFLCEATGAAFPQPAAEHQRAACFANVYRQLSVCSAVTCLACLTLQRASTPRARVLAGSGVRRSPPRRLRTRHAGAAAGFARVENSLSSGCALLVVVGFCWVIC